ncbi:MAG: hypothetical protein PGN25_04905 [Methylorubrum populi]
MHRAFDWFFRDRRSGGIVIGQWPNLPLWIFGAAAGTNWLLETVMPGLPAPVFLSLRIVALASLAVWAIDEIVRGVNPWRRCLGAAVLVGLVLSLAGRP